MSDDTLVFPEAAEAVVDEFEPKLQLEVTFDGIPAIEGGDLTPTQCQHLPSIKFAGEKEKLYTIILSDPDAPSVADPKFGEWQHWISVNTPADDVSAGDAITAYFGSAPGKDSGKHRYVLVAYEQAGKIEPDEERVSATSGFPPRRSFKSRAFASKYDLTPVAVLTYRAEFDDSVPELAKKLQGIA
jgi:phosphatidylethanolamine-binding protein (PEBP) family uncharacterized protein